MKGLSQRSLLTIFFAICALFSWAQLPYLEDFSSNAGKGVTNGVYDTTGMDWTLDASACTFTATSDYIKINGNVFEAQDIDGEAIWTSPTIDISSVSYVDLSVDVAENGDSESDDYVKVYYAVDGGAETLFTYNGENTDDFTNATAKQFYVAGSSIQIIIKVANNTGTEQHTFDNVSISEGTYVSPTTGALVITEYARHTTSSYGYLEVYNTTNNNIDLGTIKVVSEGSNNAVYDFGVDITGNTYVPANGFLILNRSVSQASFESQWTSTTGTTISLGEDVVYFQTGENAFGNQNQYKIRIGGTADTDDGTLLEESTAKPSSLGKRVYQMPLGYWTNNEEAHTQATPGYLGALEKIEDINLAYADGSWQAATGYAHSAPNSSTGSASAIILRGQATFNDGSVLDKLTILSDAGTSINNESITVTSELHLANDASLAITGSGSVSCSGAITIEKDGHNLSSDYNVWGSPFATAMAIDNVFTNHFSCDFYAFEASTQSWKYDETVGETVNCNGNNYTVTSNMVLSTTNSEGTPDGNFDTGRGYFIPGTTNNTISFAIASSGSLNNGTINVQIFGSSEALTDGSNDWNLISNPYPSSVSVADFLTTNSGAGKLDNAVYLYDAGTGAYSSYNSSDNSTYISSCQGFYVNGNTTTDGLAYTISFTNAMRHHTDNDFRSTVPLTGIYLSVADSHMQTDQTRLYFDAQAQDGYDVLYDAHKLHNAHFNFASKIDTNTYVFNGLTALNTTDKEIPLYFQTTQAGNYQLSIDSLLGMAQYRDVILEDRELHTFTNLKNTSYSFYSDAQTWDQRFFLHVVTAANNSSSTPEIIGGDSNTSVTSIQEHEGTLTAFVVNNNLHIQWDSPELALDHIQLISAAGTVVNHQQITANQEIIPLAAHASGIYYLRAITKNGDTLFKAILVQ